MDQSFSEMVRARLRELRLAADLQEVILYGSIPDEARAMIDAHGQMGEYHYAVWCDSETCMHWSHDTGEASWHVYLPAAWLAEAAMAAPVEWDLRDQEVPVALLPTEPPTLLVTVTRGHWARGTRLIQLRPEAAALLDGQGKEGGL